MMMPRMKEPIMVVVLMWLAAAFVVIVVFHRVAIRFYWHSILYRRYRRLHDGPSSNNHATNRLPNEHLTLL